MAVPLNITLDEAIRAWSVSSGRKDQPVHQRHDTSASRWRSTGRTGPEGGTDERQIGLMVGIAATVALRQVIASQLYGIGALDPLVLASVSGVLMLAALSACLVPARRAASVNPAIALTRH